MYYFLLACTSASAFVLLIVVILFVVVVFGLGCSVQAGVRVLFHAYNSGFRVIRVYSIGDITAISII
jgi:hypothetical protein